ncbi:MAG: hypothetical protein AAGF23_06240 [Acidobacteriota bacterium]
MSRLLTTIGADIGQKKDPTAIAVAEIDMRPSPLAMQRKEAHFLIRHAERLPLGTSYPRVAERIGEICHGVKSRGGGGSRPHLFVDATGVGQPIIDLLHDAALEAAAIWSTYFTHGDQRKECSRELRISLGKAFLVSRLQMLLQCGRIHLPKDHPEADALVKELLDYEIRVGKDSNDQYGAFRVGTHDDLVTALGLAVQKEPSVSVFPGRVVYGM